MSNSSCNFIPLDINSYDGKLMFSAIICLLLVISFVLLLHAYARWVFVFGQSADRQRLAALSLSTTTTITTTTTTTRLHHHLHTDDNHQISSFDDDIDGLDVSVITSIPIFVHKSDDNHMCNKLECAICLSVFEENDVGRHLPSCNHAFHLQCIDKWLRSHSTCPICRAVVGSKKTVESKSIMAIDDVVIQERTERSRVHSDSPENEGPALEVVIEMPPLESNSECNVHDSSLPSPPPAAPPLPQLCTGYYLKRILSMNIAENKVFPSSSNVNDLNV